MMIFCILFCFQFSLHSSITLPSLVTVFVLDFAEHFSAEHNATFWVHVASGTSTWERPSLVAEVGELPAAAAGEVDDTTGRPAAAAAAAAAALAEGDGKRALPEGWQEVWDEASNTHYYWHPDTQKSSWKHPEDDDE